ncbi:MAG: hotdog domain-containing protein [Bacteroidota bacterium]
MITNDTNANNVKLVLDTVSISSFLVFPQDMNYAGTLFGGKILAEMDRAALKAARRVLYGTDCDGAVTVSFDKVDFKKPAHLGDIIELTARITRFGRTSIQIHVQVSKEDHEGKIETICEASIVFVSVKDGKAHPHYCEFAKQLNHQQN